MILFNMLTINTWTCIIIYVMKLNRKENKILNLNDKHGKIFQFIVIIVVQINEESFTFVQLSPHY